jgi:ParB family chromosome partitioning protein
MPEKKRAGLTFEPPETLRERAELDRILTSDQGPVQVAGLELRAVRLDAIAPDPDQPRKHSDPATLADLAESIRQQGVIQPIEVEPAPDGPGRFIIVHGERRWRAAQMAGLETIPAIIRPSRLDRATRLIRQLIENLQREDLNDMDRAAGLVSLRELLQSAQDAEAAAQGGKGARVTWEEVGERVGLTKGRISQLLGLLALPEPIQEDVRAGHLTEYDTRPYRGLTPEQQVELHRVRQEQGLSTEQVREVAKILRKDASRPVAETVHLVITPPPAPEPVAEPAAKPSPKPRPEPTPSGTPQPILPKEISSLEPDPAVLHMLDTLPTPRAFVTLLAALHALTRRPDFEFDNLPDALEAIARELRARGRV